MSYAKEYIWNIFQEGKYCYKKHPSLPLVPQRVEGSGAAWEGVELGGGKVPWISFILLRRRQTGVWNTTSRDFLGQTYTHCMLRIVWLLHTAQYPCLHGRGEISHPIHRQRRGPSSCCFERKFLPMPISCRARMMLLWRFGDTVSYTKVAHGSTQIQACIYLGTDLYLSQYQTIPISVPIHTYFSSNPYLSQCHTSTSPYLTQGH